MALLTSCDQNDLDVEWSSDGSINLVERGNLSKVCEWIFGWIFRCIGDERNLDLSAYTKRVHRIFFHHNSPDKEEFIQDFYRNGLRKWDEQTFNRSQLSEKVQDTIFPRLKETRERFNAERRAGANGYEAEMDYALAKSELAFDLGIETKQNNKGATGSLVFHDLKGRAQVIYKEQDAPLSWKRTIAHKYKQIFKQHRQVDLCHHNQIDAEFAAYLGDRYFEIGLVPTTRRVPLDKEKSKFASFQLWKHGMVEAKDFRWDHEPTPDELSLFQRMIIYDYLIGNLDRHQENWLVASSDRIHLSALAMIDNANAFPEEHPSDDGHDDYVLKKIYYWKNHPWANKPLTLDSLQLIGKITGDIEGFKQAINDELPDFLIGQREQRLDERATMLFAVGRYKLTPTELGSMYSSDRIVEQINVLNSRIQLVL